MPLTLEPDRVSIVEVDGQQVRICNVPGCGAIHRARGACYRHYRRWYDVQRHAADKALSVRTQAAVRAQAHSDPE